jgi:hypothetical protein
VLAFFFCAGLHAQTTIGGLTDPAAGALLDLNSTAKGGLLLSNVNIVDPDFIPDGDPNVFPGVDPDSLDTNWGLRGALAYNTNPATGVGIYVWTGKYWMPATETETAEQILFTVRTADGTYKIQTRGYVGGTYAHTYDWNISVDGGMVEHHTGTGGANAVITLSGLTSGDHQIRITPYDDPLPGWGNAYGHSNGDGSDEKLISIDAPLTTLAFAPKTTETSAATNASYMFFCLFRDSPNLTAPAVIKDTYKLPATVTDLSYFFGHVYIGCTSFTAPQDLTPLKGWLDGNNSIQNLGSIFAYAYANCTNLTAPIDLAPLSGWFNNNTSISSITGIFGNLHMNCNLTAPIDLAPLSGWFSNNTSISSINGIFSGCHRDNPALSTPINFTPLSGWFNDNTSIAIANSLFHFVHYNNPNLRLSGQIIFPNWLKTLKYGAEALINVEYQSFYQMFRLDSAQGGDTGEPKFQDGTVLSSMGIPRLNWQVYLNRTGITPLNSNWK